MTYHITFIYTLYMWKIHKAKLIIQFDNTQCRSFIINVSNMFYYPSNLSHTYIHIFYDINFIYNICIYERRIIFMMVGFILRIYCTIHIP